MLLNISHLMSLDPPNTHLKKTIHSTRALLLFMAMWRIDSLQALSFIVKLSENCIWNGERWGLDGIQITVPRTADIFVLWWIKWIRQLICREYHIWESNGRKISLLVHKLICNCTIIHYIEVQRSQAGMYWVEVVRRTRGGGGSGLINRRQDTETELSQQQARRYGVNTYKN